MCAGFQYFGLQYASQCFCGNEYDSGGQADEADCSSACSGDATIMCGGSWRNSVYEITGAVDLDVLQTAVTYSYVGCYVDASSRDLGAVENNMGPDASPRLCAELCIGYTYYGLQAGVQCFCDNDYGDYGDTADAECSTDCSGHATGADAGHAKCGGNWRNSVWEITAAEDLIVLPPNEVDVSFTYIGCYMDDSTRDIGTENSPTDHGDLGAIATGQECADYCRDGGNRRNPQIQYHTTLDFV